MKNEHDKMEITLENKHNRKGITMRTSKVMAMLMAAVMMTAVTASAKDVSLKKELVDDFTKDGWRFYNGSEFPGAKGGKSLKKTMFETFLQVDYDFSAVSGR